MLSLAPYLLTQKTFLSIYRQLLTFIFIISLSGCATHYGDRCLSDIKSISQKNKLTPHIFHTKNHEIFALLGLKKSDELHVYIEGDGFAWASDTRISKDPTPIKPTGLIIAMADQTSATKVYLSRPGHYINDNRLSIYSWTFSRFSKKIIDSYVQIIDQLYNLYPNAKISLFGYSGGALIAMLTAAERYKSGKKDINRIVTFAGVLDHDIWSAFHKTTPLSFSLNSTAYLEYLRFIPQIHYSGSKDIIAPPKISQNYMNNFHNISHIKMVQVPDTTHWDNWEEFWSKESLILFKP